MQFLSAKWFVCKLHPELQKVLRGRDSTSPETTSDATVEVLEDVKPQIPVEDDKPDVVAESAPVGDTTMNENPPSLEVSENAVATQ